MKGLYRFADMNVVISSVYDEIHEMCRDYRVDDSLLLNGDVEVDISVETSMEDIARESKLSDEEREFEGLEPYQFPEPYLETLAVYRKMATVMPQSGVMLLHGSVIAVDGEGYMFTASSGTGKSTHVRLWREMFGERAVMVNDDKPLIRVSGGENPERAIVYGTPWDGKHHLSSNISVPLKAICILERGEKNEIEKLTLDDAYTMLLQQSFRPENPMGMMMVMQMLTKLAENIGLYRLKCNMDPEASRVAYEGMNK